MIRGKCKGVVLALTLVPDIISNQSKTEIGSLRVIFSNR